MPGSVPPKVAPGTPHDGRQLGWGVHRVVARLLAANKRRPSAGEILESVVLDPTLAEPHVYGLAARQRLITATAVYFRLFAPGPEWQFLDREVPVGRRSLDLVFEHARAGVRADELKSATGHSLLGSEELDEQLSDELAGGKRRYGDRFAGVRVVLLGAPSQSFLARPDASRVPLTEEGTPWRI